MRMNCFSQSFFSYLLLLTGVLFKTSNGQAYTNPYQSYANYPTNYQTQSYGAPTNYQTQSYGAGSCNDLLCKNNECCIETYLTPICVALIFDDDNQAFCARAKKCSSSAGCPTIAGCCQIIPDISFVTSSLNSYPASSNGYANSYGTTNTYGYTPSSYGYSTSNYASIRSYSNPDNFKNGYCRGPSESEHTCFQPIDGVNVGGCPCETAGDICIIPLQPFPIGACGPPPS